MKLMICKIKRYASFKDLMTSVIGMLVVFLFVAPIIITTEFLYEKYSSQESWFEYTEVLPVAHFFQKGEELRFYSIAEYKKYQKIQWFDTLYCDNGDFVRKYKTQVIPTYSPEPRQQSFINDLEDNRTTWVYNEEEVSDEAISCYICGTVVSHTPKFDQTKEWNYCTEWFDVNR